MGRTSRDKQLSNRKQKDYLDFTDKNTLSEGDITDQTEIFVRNPGRTAQKSSLGVVLGPLTERVEDLEEETARLEAVKADKCYALAMAIVL